MTPDSIKQKPSDHLVQLDGLRALAVFLVLIQHFVPQGHILLKPAVWGTVGVQLFFVLSGFLITQILLGCRCNVEAGRSSVGFSLRRFYARRFLRIFPLFYASLIVLTVFDIGVVRETLWWHVGYLSNVYLSIRGSMHGTVTHFWTLSVEEQFYLVWPWLILLTPRKWLLPALLAVIVSAPAYRFVTSFFRFNPIVRTWLPFANVDALGMGSLLALFWSDPARYDVWRRKLGTFGLYAGGAGMLVIAVLRCTDLIRWSYEILVSGSFLAMLFFPVVDRTARGCKGIAGKFLSLPPIAYFGRISYGIYVVHDFMPEVLRRMFEPLGVKVPETLPWPFLIYLTASLVVSSISWTLMEKPLNDLKRYFPYSERPVDAGLHPAEAAGRR